jgi:hypothetical protein
VQRPRHAVRDQDDGARERADTLGAVTNTAPAAGPPAARALDAALARARRRLRLRRVVVAGTLWVAAVVVLAAVGGILAAAAPFVGAPEFGREALTAIGAVAAAALAAWTVFLLSRPVAASRAARELDRRLELDDAVASAVAVRELERVTPLGRRVLVEAEEALAAASPRLERAFPLAPTPRAGVWLLRATALAALLWCLALVAASLPELSGTPNAGRPGIDDVVGGGDLVPLGAESPDEEGERPEPPGKPPEAEPDEPQKPEEEPEPEPEPDAPREPPIRARVRTSKAEYASHEPVLAVVSAVPTIELKGDATYDVRIVLDKNECDTGLALDVSPSRPEPTARALSLGELPPPMPKLQPGEHELKAVLVPRGGGKPIETETVREGQPPKPPPPKPPPKQQGGEKDPPPGEPPLPPPELDKKVVMPLFREGERVEKKGAVLVLDPSGGPSRPPRKRPLGEALPGAKQRAEQAVDRARLDEEDRELVRRYFEGLERRLR